MAAMSKTSGGEVTLESGAGDASHGSPAGGRILRMASRVKHDGFPPDEYWDEDIVEVVAERIAGLDLR